MKIYEYKVGCKLPLRDCALAIGLFDGFHIAHRALIKKTAEAAKEKGLSAGIFTFVSNESIKNGAKKIYSTEEKLMIAKSLGVDFAVVASFSDISHLTAEEFVKDTLTCDLSVKIALAGFNFKFGKGALGDAKMLTSLMKASGGEAIIFNEYTYGGITVSSTLIREHLIEGRMAEAGALLGEPYFLTGVVSHGDGRGRALGLPTVNTDIQDEKLIPKIGVYRSAVLLSGRLFSAVTNVGTCPTFGERKPHAETFILDFDGELYGESIRVYLLEYLREEKSFKDENELVLQIKLDINYTIKKNGELKWQELGLK